MDAFIQQLLNGLMTGSLYALVALGYTMVYGILRIINFAHGDVLMIGALVGLSVIRLLQATWPALPPVLVLLCATVVAMAFCAVLAVVIERVAYRRLRHAPRLAPLISGIGVSLLLQTIAIALSVMVALLVLVERTRFGRAMRAVAENPQVASLMGISPNRIIVITFAIGGALAALAGIMMASNYGSAHFYMGFLPGIKAFTAAVLGGIGNLKGAMLGGLLLGLIEALGTGYLGAATNGVFGSNYQDVFAFIVLIAVLVFRPSGLLGERLATRA